MKKSSRGLIHNVCPLPWPKWYMGHGLDRTPTGAGNVVWPFVRCWQRGSRSKAPRQKAPDKRHSAKRPLTISPGIKAKKKQGLDFFRIGGP